MSARIATVTTVSDAIKEMLRKQLRAGWTSEHVAYEMQKLGHTGWKAHTATSLVVKGTRPLSVDEAIGLMAVLKSRSQLVIREVDRLTALLVREEGKGNDQSRSV
jgi:hypothetical protein